MAVEIVNQAAQLLVQIGFKNCGIYFSFVNMVTEMVIDRLIKMLHLLGISPRLSQRCQRRRMSEKIITFQTGVPNQVQTSVEFVDPCNGFGSNPFSGLNKI